MLPFSGVSAEYVSRRTSGSCGHDVVMYRSVHLDPINGTTTTWNDDEGWGTVSAPEVSGEILVLFSNIEGTGYRALRAGQNVTFTYETPGQDGYPHQAISVTPL
jgi:CspA family cold shock protein